MAALGKVNSSKAKTIPKLELMAAKKGVQVAQQVLEAWKWSWDRVDFFVDSLNVLTWIRAPGQGVEAFMARYAAQIREVTDPAAWSYVPTEENPADLVSRGALLEELRESTLWNSGPRFLRDGRDKWPTHAIPLQPYVELPEEEELVKLIGIYVSTHDQKTRPGELAERARRAQGEPQTETGVLDRLLRISCWYQRCKVAGLVALAGERFLKSIRTATRRAGKGQGGDLPQDPPPPSGGEKTGLVQGGLVSQRQSEEQPQSTEEKAREPREEHRDSKVEPRERQPTRRGLAFAYKGFILLARLTQARVWQGRTAASLKSSDSPFRKDLQGKVLKDRGPLIVMQDRTTGRWLPILPRRAPVTRDLLIFAHAELLQHVGGHRETVGEVRQFAWPLGALQEAHIQIRNCVSCRKRKPVPFERQMGRLHAPLPCLQENPPKAFTTTYIDIAGPIECLAWGKRTKRYALVATCASLRAIHLEPVKTLETESILLALHRFAVRRGMPQTIVSDNASYFELAAKMLAATAYPFSRPKVHHAAPDSQRGVRLVGWNEVEWVFYSPRAPYQGGMVESMVKLTKNALTKMQPKYMKEEEFHTLLVLAEEIANKRPLGVVTEEGSPRILRATEFLRAGYAPNLDLFPVPDILYLRAEGLERRDEFSNCRIKSQSIIYLPLESQSAKMLNLAQRNPGKLI